MNAALVTQPDIKKKMPFFALRFQSVGCLGAQNSLLVCHHMYQGFI